MKGSAGQLTFKRSGGQTVVSEKTTEVKNPKTSAQQRHRMKWANVIKMYKGIIPNLLCAFENKEANLSDYNMFVKLNMQRSPVYLTKQEVSGGGCVVAPYQLSQGSLPSVATTGSGATRKTNINLGNLVISNSTTIGQLSQAILAPENGNKNWKAGDELAFFNIVQETNELTDIPYARFEAYKIVLDKDNGALLWDEVLQEGFSSDNGYLAANFSSNDNCYCWIHSRKSDGKTLVSTQMLLNNNGLLSTYTTEHAYQRAVATYGGENEVFLRPGDSAASSSVHYTLSVVSEDSSKGTVSGGGAFDEGDEPTFTATPAEGYEFDGWYRNGARFSTDNPGSLTMPAGNVTVEARFTAVSGVLIELGVATGQGKVSINGGEPQTSISQRFEVGTEITIRATPDSGYTFDSWTWGGDDNPKTFSVTEAKTINAKFESL